MTDTRNQLPDKERELIRKKELSVTLQEIGAIAYQLETEQPVLCMSGRTIKLGFEEPAFNSNVKTIGEYLEGINLRVKKREAMICATRFALPLLKSVKAAEKTVQDKIKSIAGLVSEKFETNVLGEKSIKICERLSDSTGRGAQKDITYLNFLKKKDGTGQEYDIVIGYQIVRTSPQGKKAKEIERRIIYSAKV